MLKHLKPLESIMVVRKTCIWSCIHSNAALPYSQIWSSVLLDYHRNIWPWKTWNEWARSRSLSKGRNLTSWYMLGNARRPDLSLQFSDFLSELLKLLRYYKGLKPTWDSFSSWWDGSRGWDSSLYSSHSCRLLWTWGTCSATTFWTATMSLINSSRVNVMFGWWTLEGDLPKGLLEPWSSSLRVCHVLICEWEHTLDRLSTDGTNDEAWLDQAW